MRRAGVLACYWIVISVAAFFLISVNVPYAYLLGPLARVLLFPGDGGWSELRRWRRWAEAIVLAFLWAAMPWFMWAYLERPLHDAGMMPLWMPDPSIGGSVVWWSLGVAVYFGLLHRRLSAAVIAGALAMQFHWMTFGGWLDYWVRDHVASPVLGGYLLYGLMLGLTLSVVDILSSLLSRRSRS